MHVHGKHWKNDSGEHVQQIDRYCQRMKNESMFFMVTGFSAPACHENQLYGWRRRRKNRRNYHALILHALSIYLLYVDMLSAAIFHAFRASFLMSGHAHFMHWMMYFYNDVFLHHAVR